jgi:predicted O-methyltransferase YrrM
MNRAGIGAGRLFSRRRGEVMDLAEVLRAQPKFHETAGGEPASYQLDTNILAFIASHISEGSRTLETGAGVSTVLFALMRAHHTCLVPAEEEVVRIKRFCREHGISTDRMRFEIDRSERCLPALDVSGLDLVLLDGAHGFPIPFIDWYYTADRLKIGGLLVIDDTHVWTGYILKAFLTAEPEWRLEIDYPPRSAVFTKLRDGSCGKNEWHQPYVVEQTLDFMFETHPEYALSLRRFAPKEPFDRRAGALTFRSRYLARHAVSYARIAASQLMPPAVKRVIKRRLGL